MITYAKEKFSDIHDEVIEFAKNHWDETEEYRHGEPYNPNIDLYNHLEKLGMYHHFTARKDGKLIGHFGLYLQKSMHTQIMSALEDSWFVLPEFRTTGIGVILCKMAEQYADSIGAKSITIDTKNVNNAGKVLKKLGYDVIGEIHYKTLGE